MLCENRLCIYFEDNHCTLPQISINQAGACDACIRIDFDEAELIPKRFYIRSIYGRNESTGTPAEKKEA